MKLVRNLTASGVISLGLLLPAARTAAGQTTTAVPKLDHKQFMGTWHEVARYPNKAEKLCVSDAVQLFAERYKANQFTLVTNCQTKKGPSDARNYNGKMDESGDGKLKVTTIWPFSRKLWVVALGPDYNWALIGSPNHKSLWILSRTAVMKPQVLAELKTKAAAEGFDPDKLIFSPQHP